MNVVLGGVGALLRLSCICSVRCDIIQQVYGLCVPEANIYARSASQMIFYMPRLYWICAERKNINHIQLTHPHRKTAQLELRTNDMIAMCIVVGIIIMIIFIVRINIYSATTYSRVITSRRTLPGFIYVRRATLRRRLAPPVVYSGLCSASHAHCVANRAVSHFCARAGFLVPFTNVSLM